MLQLLQSFFFIAKKNFFLSFLNYSFLVFLVVLASKEFFKYFAKFKFAMEKHFQLHEIKVILNVKVLLEKSCLDLDKIFKRKKNQFKLTLNIHFWSYSLFIDSIYRCNPHKSNHADE